MRKLLSTLATAMFALSGSSASAQPINCLAIDEDDFAAGNETVRLVKGDGLESSSAFGIYKAPLAVNTDGAPNSYHPDDFLGATLAINRIDNGIAIRRSGGGSISTSKKREVFAEWRDAGWVVPSGFRISWQNVIAEGSDGKPCVFSSGDHKGYFGSLTALQNALPASQAGECGVNNNLDQRFIPAIVLRGEENPLRDYGARTGDLVLALNPASGALVPAIIGDTGDGNRIGEGSVALNMALLGRTQQPANYTEALTLDTGNADMIVAVFPGSRAFERVRPYTADNIAARVSSWAVAAGYGSIEDLANLMRTCATGL